MKITCKFSAILGVCLILITAPFMWFDIVSFDTVNSLPDKIFMVIATLALGVSNIADAIKPKEKDNKNIDNEPE